MKSYNHYSFLFIIVVLLMTSACTDEINTTESTGVIEETEIKLNTTDEIFDSWDDFYSKEDISFSIDSFHIQDTLSGELFVRSFTPDDNYFKNYGSLLSYNSDSTMYIDAYSISWIIETNEKGELEARGGEVDHEVAVINIQNNTRTRLLFCGPSCLIQRAFWYNEEIVGVMGMTSEYTDEYYTPTIWFVNINNGITIPYIYNESISILHANEYDERYLKSKGINVLY